MNFILSNKNGICLKTAKKYCEEDINVILDDTNRANLVPENIKNGVTILGVDGTYQGNSSGGSSSATLSFDVATATLSISEG